MDIPAIIALAIVFELITALCRLVLQLRSRPLQARIGMPRIHHGYIGMLFLLLSLAFPIAAHALWIIGWALIISDLVHHYTVLPLLSIFEVDIEKAHYGVSAIALRRKVLIAFCALLVVVALATLATSVWLGLIASIMIFVSEELATLLPKLRCPQEVAQHF